MVWWQLLPVGIYMFMAVRAMRPTVSVGHKTVTAQVQLVMLQG